MNNVNVKNEKSLKENIHKIKRNSNFLYDFLISGVAAAVGKTIVAPIERIKLLMQNQFIIQSSHAKYNNILHCGKEIVKKEGFFALWRGNVINVIRYVPTQAFNFAFKDLFKTMFRKFDQKKEFWKFFAANCFSGGLACAISLLIIYPLDMARTRLATDNISKYGLRTYKGSIDCIVKIYKVDGVIGLYKGYFVAVIGLSLFKAFYFGGYDSLKGNYITDDTSWETKFMYAQIVTSLSAFMFYPFDTVRRRVMIQSGRDLSEKVYSSNIDCFTKIIKQEGIKGFHKGFSAQLIRTIGAASILVLYDGIQEYFGLERRKLGGI